MALKTGIKNIAALKLGANNVARVYRGGNIIFDTLLETDLFIFIGGDTNTVQKRLKEDFSLIAESSAFTSAVRAITVDEDFIYAGGIFTGVSKLDKNNLSLIGSTPSTTRCYDLATDDNFIFGAFNNDLSTSGDRRAIKFNKNTLAFIEQTPNYSNGVFSLAIDDTYMYLGAGERLHRFLKSNITTVDLLGPLYFSTAGRIFYVRIFENEIFIIGNFTTTTTRRLHKYSLPDLDNLVVTNTNLASNIFARGLAITNDKVYTVWNNRIVSYNKNNLGDSVLRTSITGQSIFSDQEKVYAGISGNITEINQTNLSTIRSQAVGGTVEVIK